MSKSKAFTITSPIGAIRILANENGVERLREATKEDILSAEDRYTANDVDPTSRHVFVCKNWLEQYFSNPSKMVDIEEPCLDFQERNGFQEKVWHVLKEQTKLGEVISYGDLAALAGSPKACQAVGNAMRKNPFPFIVPCHRVVPSSGKIGNYSYSGGSETKQWLLEHEQRYATA